MPVTPPDTTPLTTEQTSASTVAAAHKPHQSMVEPLVIGDTVFDLADHTPMMVQYLTMKAQYPHALLLYRMGDFYELFFEDAKRAAQILDITLTRRGSDKAGNTIAMAGVPFHAADSYMARLIAAGQTVVVCEQVEETAPACDTQSRNDPAAPATRGETSKKDKSKSGSIMRREVVKTLTAGTLTDEALIAPNQTPTVVAIDVAARQSRQRMRPLQAGISQLDLAAGTLTTQSLSVAQPSRNDDAQTVASGDRHHDDSTHDLRQQMLTVLTRFAPSECIVSEAMDETWLAWLRDQLACPVIEVAAADFHPDHAVATLCQQFEVQRLDGLGIAEVPLSQSSCAALIHYARQTQQRQIPQVNQLIVEQQDDYLIIDANSQANLELFAPVTQNGTALIHVLNHCQTPMGRRLLVQQMKRPLRQHRLIDLRLDAIEALLSAGNLAADGDTTATTALGPSLVARMRETLGRIGDIERISSRIALMSAKPRDLLKLAEGINSSDQLTTLLHHAPIHHEDSGLLPILLQQLPQQLTGVRAVARLIEQAIVDEPPAHTREGGMIAEGYDDEFDRLTHLHDHIQATLDEMVAQARKDYQLPSLKVGFNKVSGFYFELPKGQAQSAPAQFIRRQTLKNSERFITEALKEVETEYLSAQNMALVREKQLYHDLLTALAAHLPELQQLSAAVAQLDVLSNWAHLASIYNWQRPLMTGKASDHNPSDSPDHSPNHSIDNKSDHLPDPQSMLPPNVDDAEHLHQHPGSSSSIDITLGRHVVVEAALRQKESRRHDQGGHFVANDCALGTAASPERLLIITGPNMGGKSTYMRQTALIVLLAHCGSFVPAASARIGDIDRIFTRIGSADDLAGGKSTFMVEMIETATILNQATDKSLVLMDEVGRGTATRDGLAIAHACVNKLRQIGCLTLFATHYFELTQLASQTTTSADSGHSPAAIRNVHVAASEVDGQLLLLHQIRAGAASSSFGLHVAKMAGIPTAVLQDAKGYLTQSSAPMEVSTPSAAYEQQAQPDLLAASIDDSQAAALALIEELKTLDPDELTPRQALEVLYHLKQRHRG